MVYVPKITEFDLNVDTAYLTGVIIGDGHISGDYRSFPPRDEIDPKIAIEGGNRVFICDEVKPLVDKTILRSCNVTERGSRGINRNPTWVLAFRSKYFHKFLTEDLGLPKGKKAEKISLRVILEKINDRAEVKRALIAGIFDTDGGLRGNSIGHCTASKSLRDEMIDLLAENDIAATRSEWVNKRYNKKYYDWRIKRHESIRSFLEKIPLRNKIRKERIRQRFCAAPAAKVV